MARDTVRNILSGNAGRTNIALACGPRVRTRSSASRSVRERNRVSANGGWLLQLSLQRHGQIVRSIRTAPPPLDQKRRGGLERTHRRRRLATTHHLELLRR